MRTDVVLRLPLIKVNQAGPGPNGDMIELPGSARMLKEIRL